ncbi:MAG TPA: response regulator [Usitatibacter sp.]|nr:response regulator [Usitatibacter sp.]
MGRRILVVEDDEKSRRLLTDVLSYHGYEVSAVPDGEEGVRRAAGEPPDAALLDIQLPGISGFEVLAALRAAGARRMPVVAVTASVMDQDRKKILAAGFDAFVSKPVNIRELLRTLDELLARSGA